MNTSAPNTRPTLQHQETKIQEDQQQDSEEEIEANFEDELVCSTRRMSACDSCRESWLGERQWRKDPRSCSSRSNKKVQLKQSCSEQ
jgi:hypothetical protein